jgi:hypothetical protein
VAHDFGHAYKKYAPRQKASGNLSLPLTYL